MVAAHCSVQASYTVQQPYDPISARPNSNFDISPAGFAHVEKQVRTSQSEIWTYAGFMFK